MSFSRLFLSLFWALASVAVFAQSDIARPKLFELVFNTTIQGKEETLRSILVESRRGQVILETGLGAIPQTYKIQTYLLRKHSTSNTSSTHLLHAQVFHQEANKWVLVNEPTLEVREGFPASMTLDGGQDKAPLSIAFREIPPSEATAACARIRGRALTDAELDAAFLRLDAPSPNSQQRCCTSDCGGGSRLRCCWGALCCESGDCGCCIGGI